VSNKEDGQTIIPLL